MNKGIIAMLLCAMALVSGCGIFGNGKIDVVTPYEAGRIFVFMDVVTEPIQPDELKIVTGQVYALAKLNVTSDFTDELVKQQIAELYPDATEEFRAVLFNLYDALTIKLTAQLDAHAELPKIEVLSEFNRGINDALALYKPENP